MQDRYRLKKTADFRRVYSARRRRDGRLMTVCYRPNQLEHPRLGFSVSTKIGGSVVRNAVKRRLKEVCSAWLKGSGNAALDIVVVARPEAATAAFAALNEELTGLLLRLEP
jgi:ribonuclease P protein component